MKKLLTVAVTLALITPTSVAWGELSKQDKKRIKSSLSGTLYLRMDAPCATGRHVMGVYKRPLVKISPDGVNTEAGMIFNAGWWHADSTYWGIRVNDSVKLDEMDFEVEDGEVEVELNGLGLAAGNDTVLLFVDIYSIDDFEAAFAKTFSRQPLQEEHPDWPVDVREAIGRRELMDGMTKKQAFYVTGAPKTFEKSEEQGKKIEVWHLRQEKGMKTGYYTMQMGEASGLAAAIRFENGVLTGVGESGSGTSSGFSLEDDD